MIDDEDCEVGWPCPVDDEYIRPQGILRSPPGQLAHSSLATVIPVVRFISQLKKTLKARVIAPATLKTYDDYFHVVSSSFPLQYQLSSDTHLEPHTLPVVFSLQAARFHLYRHNLSTNCPSPERIDALRRCLAVALDSVRFILRSLQPPGSQLDLQSHVRHALQDALSHDHKWQSCLLSTTSDMLCTHLWRCMLILCFRGEYAAALTCSHVSSTIGDLRRVNIACGRNLAFFLDRLAERTRSGNGGQQQLEVDEEMLAYVSGDMQGDTENSWVWAGSDTGIKLNSSVTVASAVDMNHRVNGEIVDGVQPSQPPSSALLTEKETKEWGGWERIRGTITSLMDEQHNRQAQYYQPTHNNVKRLHLTPPEASVSAKSTGVSPGGTSRISIANII